MKYLAGWRGVVYSAANGCFDLVRRCCRVTLSGRPAIQLACDHRFPTSNTGSRKYYLWKKNNWLKNRPFFITENFQGIMHRLCADPMRRSYDYLSLTLAVVGSTSGSCYFLLVKVNQIKKLSFMNMCVCLCVCVYEGEQTPSHIFRQFFEYVISAFLSSEVSVLIM